MAWYSLVLCSEFTGKLVNQDGSPAAGVTISRKWNWAWQERTGHDITVTDAHGNFSFDKVTNNSISARFFLHKPSVMAEVAALFHEQYVILFSINKSNYADHGELIGIYAKHRQLNMTCTLDKEPTPNGPYWATCRFN